MEFEVTEIKMLGAGIGRSLSLRLDRVPDANAATGAIPTRSAHTLHAVVPYSPEFGNVQVGQKFKFERLEETLQERIVANAIFPEGIKISELICNYHKCRLGFAHNIGTAGCKNPNTKAQ